MSGGCDVGKGSRGAVRRWVEERGPHRDGRDWSNAEAMGTRPKIPASPLAASRRRIPLEITHTSESSASEGECRRDAVDTFHVVGDFVLLCTAARGSREPCFPKR